MSRGQQANKDRRILVSRATFVAVVMGLLACPGTSWHAIASITFRHVEAKSGSCWSGTVAAALSDLPTH